MMNSNNILINKTLNKINEKLSNKILWAVFGGVAVGIHNGKLYRDFEDIDIIIENNDDELKKLIPNLENCDRGDRKKRCTKINNISVEFMLMVGQNEIKLADGKFKFQNIEKTKINNLEIPTIDLQSLYCAKLRHKESLEKEAQKMKNKLKNCNNDIEIIQSILSKD